MRTRQSESGAVPTLGGKERGAIGEILRYIEDRVRRAEPLCASFARKARLALNRANGGQDPDRTVH